MLVALQWWFGGGAMTSVGHPEMVAAGCLDGLLFVQASTVLSTALLCKT
jgi:hypothetical protein